METWTLILAAAGAVVLVGLAGAKDLVTTWFAARRARLLRDEQFEERRTREEERRRMEQRYADGFGQMLEFHQAFQDLRDVTGVTRVVILRGFNGGGLPRAGEPYYVRAQAAWPQDVKGRYNFDLPVDEAYIKMVIEVATTGMVSLLTKAMPPCLLREFYEEEGVVHSLVYRLHLNEFRFLFVSVASYEGEFTHKQQADIHRRVLRMAALVDASDGPATLP